MEHKYNAAQTILIAIGGTGVLAGGYEGNAIPDLQTPKKAKKIKTHPYGVGLRNAITARSLAKLEAKHNA